MRRVHAEHARLAAAARAVALEDLDDRRLARAVGPQQTEHLAASHLEADPTHSLHLAVGLAQVAHLDGQSVRLCIGRCHATQPRLRARPRVSGERPKSAVTYVTAAAALRRGDRRRDVGGYAGASVPALAIDLRSRARTRAPPIAPARSASRAPPAAASSSQRAASTRKMWPWAKASASPSAPREPRQHAVRAGAHLSRLLAARAAVPPQVPAGWSLTDLRRGQALVVAVVPLAQVLADLRPIAESGQLAGLARPPQRAGTAPARTSSGRASARSACARSRPSSSSGRSVRLVCWPLRLHSVSPWRTRTIAIDSNPLRDPRRGLRRRPRRRPRARSSRARAASSSPESGCSDSR